MPEKRTIFILPILIRFHAVADSVRSMAWRCCAEQWVRVRNKPITTLTTRIVEPSWIPALSQMVLILGHTILGRRLCDHSMPPITLSQQRERAKKLFAGARHRLPRSCTCRPLERPPATPGPVSSRGGARPLIRTSPFCSGSWSLADRQARPVARGGLRSHCARACRVRGSDAARGSLPSLEWWSVFPLSESLPT